jgi:hypothetical protein
MNLIDPPGWNSLPKSERDRICNGCGPGRWGSWIVPDKFRLIGVDFSPACDRHDFCYIVGIGKKKADNLFFRNMSIIADEAFFLFRPIAHRLAFLYYLAVKHCGAGFYRH